MSSDFAQNAHDQSEHLEVQMGSPIAQAVRECRICFSSES